MITAVHPLTRMDHLRARLAYTASVWIERDRAHLSLEDSEGRTVFDLWDEQVNEAIEDGFLKAPRFPRATERDWLPCLIEYALEQGLIPDD